uniref:Uncharacterized protein n=1 Tax=Heliothis virescens TaxID=7102 RepID=A0A2A4J7X4_HELVI
MRQLTEDDWEQLRYANLNEDEYKNLQNFKRGFETGPPSSTSMPSQKATSTSKPITITTGRSFTSPKRTMHPRLQELYRIRTKNFRDKTEMKKLTPDDLEQLRYANLNEDEYKNLQESKPGFETGPPSSMSTPSTSQKATSTSKPITTTTPSTSQ